MEASGPEASAMHQRKEYYQDSKKYQRASGGGRKREFEPQIKQLKDWLYRERSAGHSISKEDVVKEMESLITSELSNA